MGRREAIHPCDWLANPLSVVRYPLSGRRTTEKRTAAQTTWTQARTSGMRRFSSRLEMNSEIK
jgi:hypothetical protein